MRSWIGAISSLGGQVTIEHEYSFDPIRAARPRPQPGERERLALGPVDPERLLALVGLLPLVEAVGDDQAAEAVVEGVA